MTYLFFKEIYSLLLNPKWFFSYYEVCFSWHSKSIIFSAVSAVHNKISLEVKVFLQEMGVQCLLCNILIKRLHNTVGEIE